MTDEPLEETAEPGGEEKPKPRRRRRASTTAPAPRRTSRFERRAEKAATTLRELIHLGRPDLDISDKSFLEIVERDAKAWGEFLAQVGEWFAPFGGLIDLVFGQPLLVLLKLAPSLRAARRDLTARRERRRELREEEAQQQAEQEALRQEWQAQP